MHLRVDRGNNEFALKSNRINVIESFCSFAQTKAWAIYGKQNW